ncbi:unnamed protein product, partial [marine sediment metagenome]
EITEHHLGIIASAGIIANLIFAIIGYFIGFTDFARDAIQIKLLIGKRKIFEIIGKKAPAGNGLLRCQ